MQRISITADTDAGAAVTYPGDDPNGHPLYRIVLDGTSDVAVNVTRDQLQQIVDDAAERWHIVSQPFGTEGAGVPAEVWADIDPHLTDDAAPTIVGPGAVELCRDWSTAAAGGVQ